MAFSAINYRKIYGFENTDDVLVGVEIHTGDCARKVTLSRTAGAVSLGLASTYITWRVLRSYRTRKWFWFQVNKLLNSVKHQTNTGFRDAFNRQFSVPEETRPPRIGHSHDEAACDRTTVGKSIDNFIASQGRVVYHLSPSAKDKGLGERLFYEPRDTIQEPHYDSVPENAVIKVVDVDYYVDMPSVLSHGKPVLVYCVVPTELAMVMPGATYFFKENNELHYMVNGGASFVHQVWDYSRDWFTIETTFGFWNVSYTAKDTHYPERKVVCLTPETWFPKPSNWLLSTYPLQRLKVQEGHFNMLKTLQPDGTTVVSVGRPGDLSIVTLPEVLYEIICERTKNTTRFGVSDIERLFNNLKPPLRPGYTYALLASHLYSLIQEGLVPIKTKTRAIGAGKVENVSYQITTGLITEEGKGYVREVCPRIAKGACAPKVSINNMNAAISGRIFNTRNFMVNPTYETLRAEFVDAIGCSNLAAYEHHIVREILNKPLQRRRIESIWEFNAPEPARVKSFMKQEVYGKCTDPRNISSMNPTHLLRFSSYMLPLSNALKQHAPYMSGKTPTEIADSLTALAHRHSKLLEVDFSRYDGHQNEFTNSVFRAVALRAFNCDEELDKLIQNDENAKCRTKYGDEYESYFSTKSGSACTSVKNTIIHWFVAYCALRRAVKEPELCIEWCGAVMSDDGVVVAHKKDYESVCRDLGLPVKIVEVPMGKPTKFLGRIFLDLWTTNGSIQQPRRTLPKLHLTVTSHSTPETIAMINKAKGYLVTDPRTPIIAPYCELILKVFGDTNAEDQELEKDLPYNSGPWPADESDSLSWTIFADEVGQSVEYCKKIDSQIRSAKSFTDVPTDVFDLTEVPTVEVVQGGELLKPAEKDPQKESVAESAAHHIIVGNLQVPLNTPSEDLIVPKTFVQPETPPQAPVLQPPNFCKIASKGRTALAQEGLRRRRQNHRRNKQLKKLEPQTT